VLDRGDAVEVIARGVKAARTAILPVRSRLEVPITDAPPAKRVTPRDATVVLIELERESIGPVLSVKLGFERADVKALARYAQAIQVGDDLHLLIPRKLPDGDAAPRLPEPTIPSGLIHDAAPAQPASPRPDAAAPKAAPPPAPIAAIAPVAGPRAEPAAKPEAPAARRDAKPEAPAAKPEAPAARRDATPEAPGARHDATPDAPAAGHDAKADAPAARRDANSAHPRSAAEALAANAPAADEHGGAAPAASTAPAGARPLAPALASDRDDEWAKISLYAALGLAAAGLGVWFMRRRRLGPPAPSAQIEIIAQRALGGRARIVWLGVGPREMIVAVTAQQVRVLGQWRRSESPATQPVQPAPHVERDTAPVEPRRAGARGSLPPLTPHGPHTPTGTPIAPMTMTAPTAMTAPLPAMHRRPGTPTDKPISPAVSGLLRLRRTSQMAAISSPEAEVDPAPDHDHGVDVDVVADDLWAKEILAATTRDRK
jgi:flagellar biogenesis protein FliO